MEKQKRIPKRRFREFLEAGEWEQRSLGDIASFSKGAGYSKVDLQDSGTPIILYGSLYTKYETVISDVDTFADEKPNSVFSKGGEVLVPASGETAEDISVASVVGQSGVMLGGDLNIITPPKEIDSAFLAISISNGKPHSDMAKMAQGKSVVHLHNSDLAKINLPYPSYEEQRQISRQFKSLDTLISLHQQKLAKLKDVKQAYLTEMFPAPGEKRPRRRFKGFSGNWTEKILCHLAEIKDSARVPNNLWTSEGVPYLRSSDLANKGLTGDLYISHHSYEMYKAQTGAPSMGDVLFTSGGQVGITFLKEDDSPLYVQGGAVLYVKTSSSKNLCGQYLKTFFETNIMQSYMANASVGGTIKHFTVGPASNALITYPSVEEQQLIGDFFKRIDNGLYSCQDKLNKLQSLKQAYLSELFV